MATSRQQRLAGFERPAEANFHVVRKPYLSASTLGSFYACRTKPFIQRILEVFGIETTSASMRHGAAAHEAVQGALEATVAKSDLTFKEALARKEFLLGTEVHLTDEEHRLHGFVDVMFAHRGYLRILELKNSYSPEENDPTWGVPIYPEHGIQVHVYGVAARAEVGVTAELYVTYLKDGSKEAAIEALTASKDPLEGLRKLVTGSIPVPHGPIQRERLMQEVREFQNAEKQVVIPDPQHQSAAMCGWCSVRTYCPKRLDQPGRYVTLDAKKMPDVV